MELTTDANEVLENLKMRHPKILEWDNYKIINHLSKYCTGITEKAYKKNLLMMLSTV